MSEPSSGPSSGIRLSVVIPAYNEERRLPATLGALKTYLEAQTYRSEILVVDDGSTDRTSFVVPGSSPMNV